MPLQFIITASEGPGGHITPQTGDNYADQGTDFVFTIGPSAGYLIDDVLVDSVSVGAVATYTFLNVQGAHTIHATFRAGTIDKINEILDALVVMVQGINGAAGGYLTSFQTTGALVERNPKPIDMAAVPRPYAAIRLADVLEVIPLTDNSYRITILAEIAYFIDVTGSVVSKALGERRAAMMLLDIMRAIALDVNLGTHLLTGVQWPPQASVEQNVGDGVGLTAGGVVAIHATFIFAAA